MFYIFNDKNKCIASCSFEPNIEDLESRSEFCLESETFVDVGYIYDNGTFREDKVEDLTNYETKARNYRNTLRNKLDNYLKPASTINDELVTQEQKDILINDSLLLARWPVSIGWPYVNLPELSDLCNTLLNNPVWIYPMEELTDGN
ncbi:tail fiber assembly protein [Pseudaeromonas phage vB_PpeM_ KLEP7]|nr:tail fiber assembly protein [Pseudaeromonas phage vB_PpeM_ KLEP7]